MNRIRLLLVDDHPVVREGLKLGLAHHEHIEVVGEAADGREAIDKAKLLQPDVILMDISMPVMNGLEATEALKKEAPHSKVLILTMHDDKEYVLRITKAGAHGYVLKDSPPEELLGAVVAVAMGQAFFSPRISQVLLDDYVRSAGEVSEPTNEVLSRRETEVLKYIADGLSNKEIAAKLFVSVRTVETHRERITGKLGIKSVAGLTKYAISKGIINLK